MTVERLGARHVDDAVTVLCSAFHEYPVMRYVLGSSSTNYDRRLGTLIGLFVAARILREEPLLGIRDRTGTLAGVAVVALPGDQSSPEELSLRREAVWRELRQLRAKYPVRSSQHPVRGRAGDHDSPVGNPGAGHGNRGCGRGRHRHQWWAGDGKGQLLYEVQVEAASGHKEVEVRASDGAVVEIESADRD